MSPFNVGGKAQLLIERLLVRESPGVGFALHPAEKHPSNPGGVRADQPWEGWRLEIDGNVIYDEEEKIFKMWYLGEGDDHFPFEYPTLYTAITGRDARATTGY